MTKRFCLFTLFIAALLTSWQGGFSSTAYAAGSVSSLPNGYAYVAYAVVPTNSGVTTSGPILPAWFGCRMVTYSTGDSASTTSLSSYANSGVAQTSVTNTQSGSSATVQTTASIKNVNILSGLITAAALQATVASTIDATAATSRVVGVSLTGLTVAGHTITAPAPNTTISIANLGEVVLNEQGGPNNGTNTTYVGVNAIDLHVTLANSYNLPIGSQIIIDQVNSSELRTAQPLSIGGQAYGLSSSGQGGSGSERSGFFSFAQLPCAGGTDQNGSAGSTYPGIGSTGALAANASGQISPTTSHATTSASVQNANLFAGLIQGNQISATATANWNGSGSGSATTNLTNVTITGQPVAASPPPNTKLSLPGLGYVVLNEQTSSSSTSGVAESVNAMDIVVTFTNNTYNLSVGTHIILGHADASITSFS